MATDSADDAVLRSVRAIDWSGYPMPPSSEWYEPDSVPAAFESLVEASSEQQGRAAYNAMLFAVGNNHAGVLYPAAAAAAPLVVRVAREGNDWVRHAALQILIEFVFFGVDREQFVDPTGKSVDAKEAIMAEIEGMRDDLELMTDVQSGSTAQSARELLDVLDEVDNA
jgi:hypothetical protein